MASHSPQPTTRQSVPVVPRGSWDCHTHVFGAPEQVPPTEGAYAPPAADHGMHAAMLERVGVERAMLVQPSLYGTDHRVLLDALSRGGGRFVGVGSCAASVTQGELRDLQRQGVVGLRFVGVPGPGGGAYPGTQPLQAFEHLRADMAEAGLHAQIWADLETCLSLASQGTGGMPIVLDHMAGLTPDDRPGTDRFARLAALLDRGTVWIKLSFLRRSRKPRDYSDMRDIVVALAEQARDRILWGSDWPFLRLDDPPEPAELLGRLREWLGDGLFVQCLRDNPARLLEWRHMRLDAPAGQP